MRCEMNEFTITKKVVSKINKLNFKNWSTLLCLEKEQASSKTVQEKNRKQL